MSATDDYKEFLKANLTIPSGSFNIGRISMPQMKYTKAMSILTLADIDYEITYIDPKSLKPTQVDFNRDKIVGMMLAGIDLNKFPIISTLDGYVIDGHHRYLAALNKGYDSLKSLVIDAPVAKILDLFLNSD